MVASETAEFSVLLDTADDKTIALEVDKTGIVELVVITFVITVGVHSECEQTSVVKTNVL